MDDVGTFHRFARAYDFVMPGADAATLARGLGHGERELQLVVDLAGGTGRAVRAVQKHRDSSGSRIVGDGLVVDAAPGMVKRARAHGLPAIVGDAERLPLADASVDAVLIVDAFHHLPDGDAVLAAVERVLAPGGVLVVQEFDPTTVRGRALAASEHLVGFNSTFDSLSAMRRRFDRLGLEPTVVDDGFSYVIAGIAR